MRSFPLNLKKPDPKVQMELKQIAETGSRENLSRLYEQMEHNHSTDRLRIVHLDDHCSYQWALKTTIDPDGSKTEFYQFQHSAPALEFLETAFTKNYRIDCIITDYNHPGINGYEFAKTIRKLEGNNNIKQTPIVLLSFVNKQLKEILAGFQNQYFTTSFERNTNSFEIWKYINKTIRT